MKYFGRHMTCFFLYVAIFHCVQSAVYLKDQTLINNNETEFSIENISTQEDKSKETIESSKESIEFTTISNHNSADASVELPLDSIINTSAFVETLENFTERIPFSRNYTEKSLNNNLLKEEVEIINVLKSEKSMEDFQDEIKKRDVVKKVLKDTFENPIENIQTDLTADGKEVADGSEERNIVDSNELITNFNSSKLVV